MKTIELADVKNHFPSILKDVESGNDVAISDGAQQKAIAVVVSYEKWKKTQKRKLGTLAGKGAVEFSENFKISDEELIDL
jgi:prevent-host-death family protein